MAEAAEATGENKKTSFTRVSAKSNTRRRFVGTKSHAGEKTDKLAGKLLFVSPETSFVHIVTILTLFDQLWSCTC